MRSSRYRGVRRRHRQFWSNEANSAGRLARGCGLAKIEQQNVTCLTYSIPIPCYCFYILGLLFYFSAKLVLIIYEIDITDIINIYSLFFSIPMS
jgi:hypothetical protein